MRRAYSFRARVDGDTASSGDNIAVFASVSGDVSFESPADVQDREERFEQPGAEAPGHAAIAIVIDAGRC